MLEVYRVNRRFVWDAWQFAPKAGRNTSTFQLLDDVAPHEQADYMKSQGCWDERACNPALYAGDIWIVEAGHPRKAAILQRNKATYDASLPSADELLEHDKYARLLAPPQKVAGL